MKNFTLKSIFTVLALMLAVTAYSQDRTCGMMEYMEEMKKDPILSKEYEENQQKFKAEVAKRLRADFNARGGGAIQIPVAVHFTTGNEGDRACLEALAQNQIDILNADYTASNADIATWNSISGNHVGLDAPGVANITFCLATSNHPAAVPQLVEGQPAVTIGYNFANGAGFPETDANFQGYMNFLVKPIGGLLGYSPLGGSVANGMAVVLNTNAFGSGAGCPGISPGAPYNLGRTTTHELGHFYGLNHTFNADGGGSCGGGGDGIADTPEVANSTYGCPSNPTPFSCNAPERRLTMNYMDYVNDACMYMFTPGQASNVDAYISGVLASQFKPNVCGPGTPGFSLTANDSPVYSCPNTDIEAEFNLSYTTIADFSETTTFSASGLPANATVSFTPSTLNDDGDFVMTVGNLGATAIGVYTITVTGTANSAVETVDVELFNNCSVVTCSTSTATDTPQVISDGAGGQTYTSTITVTEDLPIDDINVTFAIDHTWIRDITATLTSPEGTSVILTNINGANGAGEYQNTVFDQEAATAVEGATPTNNLFVGSYIPQEDLSVIYGEMSAGNWVLTILDNFTDDGGNLTNFEIELCLEDALSISEFELNGFAIFPNPNKGEFTIKLNSNSGSDIKVNVFDIRGRRIFNNAFSNNGDFNQTVSLDNVQSGMYLVTVNDGNNEITKRIIVE